MDRLDSVIEAQVGIKRRFLWNAGAGFFFVPGSIQMASWIFGLTPNPLPFVSVITGGVVPMTLGVVWFALGRRDTSPYPWYHFVLLAGYLVLFVTSIIDDNDNSADAIYQLMPTIIALVIFPLRQAVPYAVAGVITAPVFVLISGDPTPAHRAVAIGLGGLAVSVVLTVGQKQLRAVLERNRELSEIDELTGVANTRKLRERLRAELLASRDDRALPIALIAIDLDSFKLVNDTYNHSVGDKVLTGVAEAIGAELGERDMLARRGGDEFTVLAHDTPGRPAADLSARLHTAIHVARKSICPNLEAGSSIGFTRHEADETAESLLARSDKDLHDQKVISHRERPRSGAAVVERPAGGISSVPDNTHRAERRCALSHNDVIRNAAWKMLGAYLLALALVAPLFSSYGHLPGLDGTGAAITCVLSAVAAACCFVAAKRSHRDAQLHAGLLTAFAFTTAAVLQAGEIRNGLVEIFIVPVVIGFYAVGRRAALGYMAAGVALYIGFLETTEYDALFALRAVQTTVVLVLAGQFVPRAVKRARETAAENERLSGVDPLTGLANTRAMRERIEFELSRGADVSLLTIDLDNFKQVNDLHSHTLGDALLKSVASAIEAEVREQDLAVRRGGDEFVVVVPHAGGADLGALIARIQDAIVENRLRVCPDISPTASIGRVTARSSDTVESLLSRADDRENAAKRESRERRSLRSA